MARARDLAVLANAPSPYHAYFLRRLANELDGVRVHALFTHEAKVQPWSVERPENVRFATFADADERVGDPIWRRPVAEWRKGGRILDYLERHDVGALICQGYNSFALVRALAGRRPASRATFLRADSNVRDDDENPGWKRVLKGGLLRPLIARADGIMPVGTLGARYYVRYGVPPERIFVVPLEPDYEAIREVPDDAVRSFRDRAGLASDRRRLLYCGRLAEVKRVDLLLDAFALVAADRPEWDVVVVGDGPLAGALRSRVPAGLEARVRWLGFLDVDDVRAAYRSCDALVLPSDKEPWALVVNEAMAAGLAIVASDVVGAAFDLVEPGVNGGVFRRGDVRDLERALREVTSPDRIDRLREGSGTVLGAWRGRADPVEGVRRALAAARERNA